VKFDLPFVNDQYSNFEVEVGDSILRQGDIYPVRRVDRIFDDKPSTEDNTILVPQVPYIDDKLNTIKMVSAAASANLPRHWALCNGDDNSIEKGGTALDLRGRFLVGWEDRAPPDIPSFSDVAYETTNIGGFKTVSHFRDVGEDFLPADLSTLGYVKYGDHDNRPPWNTMVFIERIY